MRIDTLVRRHPVLTYFGLAFAISWAGCALTAGPKFLRGEPLQAVDGLLVFLAMLLGPSLAGIAMTAFLDGKDGLRELRSRMMRGRVGAAWYMTPLVFPILIVIVLAALGAFVSREFARTFAVLGIPIGLMAGFFEEIGWTGFALPRMLDTRSVLFVAVGLGLVHTIWHLAADFLTASGSRAAYWLPHFAAFIVSMTAMRVIVVWAYVNTKSVLLAQLVHASSTGFLAVLVPLALSPARDTLFYWVYSAVLWGAVAVVVAVFGKNLVRPRAG